MRITHLDYILSQGKQMNIDDLFDTVFTVNNINGNRLRKQKKEEEGKGIRVGLGFLVNS